MTKAMNDIATATILIRPSGVMYTSCTNIGWASSHNLLYRLQCRCEVCPKRLILFASFRMLCFLTVLEVCDTRCTVDAFSARCCARVLRDAILLLRPCLGVACELES